MSEQFICDECGEPIDQSKPYYQLTGNKIKIVTGILTTMDAPVTLHYHEEHLPVYKIAGEEVEGLPTTPTHPIAEPDQGT